MGEDGIILPRGPSLREDRSTVLVRKRRANNGRRGNPGEPKQ